MHRQLTRRFAAPLFAAFVVLVGVSGADAAPILRIDPPIKDVFVGDNFFLDVYIDDAEDLYAYDVEVTFDPAILEAGFATDGTFLNEGGTEATLATISMSLTSAPDNLEGFVFAADTQFDAPGASGSGFLFRLMFTALAVGESIIGFDVACDVVDPFCTALRNSNTTADNGFLGDPIAYETQNGLVRVTQRPASVPEPALLALLAIGAVARRVRRRTP